MSHEPVELLADVGLGGQEQRFGVEARGIEPRRRADEGRNGLGEPGAHRFRLAAGRGLRPGNETGDGVEPLGQHIGQRRALAGARRDERIERRLEPGQRGASDFGDLRLAVATLDHLDDAAHRKQPIEAQGPQAFGAGHGFHRRHKRRERRLVEPDFRECRIAVECQGRVAGTAGDATRDAGPCLGFDRVETLGHLQPKIEALGIDRLDFPRPTEWRRAPRRAGEAGHALQVVTREAHAIGGPDPSGRGSRAP